MSDPKENTEETHFDDGPIIPVDFTPVSAAQNRFSLKLSPAKVALSSALIVFVSAAWFVLSARSVFFDVTPLNGNVSVSGAVAIQVGPRYLIREGDIDVSISADGYYDFKRELNVGSEQAQTFEIALLPLPGFLDLSTGAVSDAEVWIDGELKDTTPLTDFELAAGEHSIELRKARYESLQTNINMEGRSTKQALALELLPAWSNISFSTSPPGATVRVDGVEVGQTPLSTEILAGEREVLIKLDAHKVWNETLTITARQDMSVEAITLEQADGLVLLRSTPSNATVTVNGEFVGQTPLELSLPPSSSHQFIFFVNGYEEARRQLQTQADGENSLFVELQPIVSSIQISASPADAQLFINNEPKGNANQTLELLAASQQIEVRREGYVPYTTTFISRPGLEQKLSVDLKSLRQQRIDSIKPELTVNGQSLKLIYPGSFTMGASRRETGRQANEVLRKVTLSKAFYMSTTEVSNAQYAKFDPAHSSGIVEGQTLSNRNQPVVRVTWENAALYCNWLSEQEGFEPFYRIADDIITGFNPDSTGYRLPTEAEWAWVARVNGDPTNLLRYPWGQDLPVTEQHGNYADISTASFLGRVMRDYNDGFIATAPVGSFAPNAMGFYDIGGNAAEWVHDFYGAGGLAGNSNELDPLGPQTGTYHVIRGSSWAHGSVTELRLAYRDYNNVARDDVGFRVARYLGEIE